MRTVVVTDNNIAAHSLSVYESF